MEDIKVGCLWHKVDGYLPVYIGRPGKGAKGPYGNPFSVDRYGLDVCLDKYKDYIKEHLHIIEPLVKAKVPLLLQCFCKKSGVDGKEKCHGDILREVIYECRENRV